MSRSSTPTQTIVRSPAPSPAPVDRPVNVRLVLSPAPTKEREKRAVVADKEKAPDRSSPQPSIEALFSRWEELAAQKSNSSDDCETTGSITPRAILRSLPDSEPEFEKEDSDSDLRALQDLLEKDLKDSSDTEMRALGLQVSEEDESDSATTESELEAAFEHKFETYEEYLHSFFFAVQCMTWDFVEERASRVMTFRKGTTIETMERTIWAYFVEKIYRHAEQIKNYTAKIAAVEEGTSEWPVMSKREMEGEVESFELLIECCWMMFKTLDWSFASARASVAGEAFDEPAPSVELSKFSLEDFALEAEQKV